MRPEGRPEDIREAMDDVRRYGDAEKSLALASAVSSLLHGHSHADITVGLATAIAGVVADLDDEDDVAFWGSVLMAFVAHGRKAIRDEMEAGHA